jgi:hypothetical protein
MCLLASTGSAQTGLRSAGLPDRTPTDPFPVSRGLPSASLPDRTVNQPIPPRPGDQFFAGPDTYKPFVDERGRPIFPFAPFGFGYVSDTSVPRAARYPETIPAGYLHFEMRPGDAQVFVDGFYMGSVDDFRRTVPGRSLQAGPHRVELRAAGYETKTFDVLIAPNQTVSYRSDLQPTSTGVRPVLAPATPKTFYVIPGCYAGDRPPRGKLPRGCDRSKLRAIPPEPALNVKR